MAGDQGAGGLDHRNTQLSASTQPPPNTSTTTNSPEGGEPMQEDTTRNTDIRPTQQPAQQRQEQQKAQFPQPASHDQGFSPRNISNSAVNTPAATPLPSSLSRTRSSHSSRASTPAAQSTSDDYFHSRHSTHRHERPEPPVTKTTLSELDVSKIIHNPKLRHDINFDPELHFRPNVDGPKGKKKGLKADSFWMTLESQLTMFALDRENFYDTYGTSDDWCLPRLLKTVKQIIQTLVPARDRALLDEGLNVELLMQQFNRGIADLEKLAHWLSGVLKSHCAPMRDDWVDKMYENLRDGNRNGNMSQLVLGMRGLLEVLEAMKLDVANHQIRCLRPVLIEDTVNFEQRFFVRRIQQGRVHVERSREWYLESLGKFADSIPTAAVHSFGDMSVFFEAFVQLMRPSVYTRPGNEPDVPFPETFAFDDERVARLRADMLNAINLEICMQVYEQFEHFGQANRDLIAEQQRRSPLIEDEPAISRTPSPFGSELNSTPSFVGSRPSSLVMSSAGSATSSPRSSFVLPTHSSEPDPSDAKAKAASLYRALTALTPSVTPDREDFEPWSKMVSDWAYEIQRRVSTPANLFVNLEQYLIDACNVEHEKFREVEQQMCDRLMVELQRRVREFKDLNGVSLFTVATGGRVHGQSGKSFDAGRERELRDAIRGTPKDPREEAGLEDFATRMAHIGILHWKVWAPLVYTGDGTGLSNEMPAPGRLDD